MSYQVLARKWRPKSFDDMVGQQHVVRALANALERGQLHHAYLFTGTRGVGKTTLARILAKALNCEQGPTAHPCGECSACREIDEGRFVDLIEVDAASRTKVEQTRELLENVPYAPARGRFKVYLIDEVHMFSAHSFNALLKTLEEPPEHVKFLLATTDPQKVPVTVLSRCLQFNLRRLLPGEIQARMQHVLTAENIGFEAAALPLLARAADGSMRDGLSLLDQAIAFGGGSVLETEVRAMLGTVSGDAALALLEALIAGDGARLLAEIDRIAALAPDFAELTRELLVLLHRLALFQQVPASLAADDPDRESLQALAAVVSAEDLQLYYQVLLTGQGDLALAPDVRTGFEMILLRALAFRPAGVSDPAGTPVAATPAPSPSAALRQPRPAPAAVPHRRAQASSAPPAAPPVAPDHGAEVPPAPAVMPAPAPQAPAPAAAPPVLAEPADWLRLVAQLPVKGIPRELANNCAFATFENGHLCLTLDPAAEHLRVSSAEKRLREALEQVLATQVRLDIRVMHPQQETLAQRRTREDHERQEGAQRSMFEDPVAEQMREQFAADWLPGSIAPED